MDIIDLMKQRHSVRQYNQTSIESHKVAVLNAFIEDINQESGMHFQLLTNEPKGFGGPMAKYGSFRNVNNYIAVVGPKGKKLSELAGYYGQMIVLKATALGLCTCWVGMKTNYSNHSIQVDSGESLVCVITIGNADDSGKPRKTKSIEALSETDVNMPDWFKRGMIAAQLAPTAMNQQRFKISLKNGLVEAKAQIGVYTKLDLGIVKYHFEIGAGKEKFIWRS